MLSSHPASRGRATAFLAFLTLFIACAPVASAQNLPPAGQGWYICSFNNYFSDMFLAPDGTDNYQHMTGAFGQFVRAKYGPQVHAMPYCARFLSQKLAENGLRDYSKQVYNNGTRSIMTGWKYAGALNPAAAAPPAAPAPGPLRSYCYMGETSASDPYNSVGRRVFFTAVAPVDQDGMRRDLFRKYVERKYGVLHDGYPTCVGGYDAQNFIPGHQERTAASIKAQGSTVIMTEWTPANHEALMAEAEKNPAPRPAETAAKKKAPPPPAAQSAYEKALAAQRPQSVSPAQLAAARQAAPANQAASAAPSAATGGATAAERYIFCYSTGSPYRGTAQSHYYVTQVFPAPAANSHPYDKFAAYLKAQHGQENISSTTCSTPQPRNTEESTRQSYIAGQRQFPNRAVVELNWTPPS